MSKIALNLNVGVFCSSIFAYEKVVYKRTEGDFPGSCGLSVSDDNQPYP